MSGTRSFASDSQFSGSRSTSPGCLRAPGWSEFPVRVSCSRLPHRAFLCPATHLHPIPKQNVEDKIEEAEKRREEKIRQVEKEFNKQLRPLYDGMNLVTHRRERRLTPLSFFLFKLGSASLPFACRGRACPCPCLHACGIYRQNRICLCSGDPRRRHCPARIDSFWFSPERIKACAKIKGTSLEMGRRVGEEDIYACI